MEVLLASIKFGFCIQLLMFFFSGIWRFEFLATASVYSYLFFFFSWGIEIEFLATASVFSIASH